MIFIPYPTTKPMNSINPMRIIQIVSEYKKIGPSFKLTPYGSWYRKKIPVEPNFKRVQAICDLSGHIATRHLDIPIT